MDVGATISEDGNYRYKLWRTMHLDEGQLDKGLVAFVMLNPSTADANRNDPTIGRCMALAKRWEYGRIEVVNLFAWRATNPKNLPDGKVAVGLENDDVIRKALAGANLVICAWGQSVLLAKDGQLRVAEVLKMIERPHHLGLSKKDGQHYPRHPNSPLVGKNTEPQLWH